VIYVTSVSRGILNKPTLIVVFGGVVWQLAALESIITLQLLTVSCTNSCPFYWICFSSLLLSSLSQLKLCSLIIFIIIIQFIQFVTLFAQSKPQQLVIHSPNESFKKARIF